MASMAELEQHHEEICELYDLSEELIDTVEHELIHAPKEQLWLVEPLVDEIGEATDILSEEFIALAEGSKQRGQNSRMESALRRIYTAIDAFHGRMEQAAEMIGEEARSLSERIVRKITRHLEAVVAMLVDFVDLSLDRIMTNRHAEELRKRQEKIASMLDAIGKAQGA